MMKNFNNSKKMPVIFIGHGSPMNAIDSNSFTKTLNKLGNNLPAPKAILVISAHWMTKGTWVTAMNSPKTIHDFYGFPQELFDVQYPAPGNPEIAKLIQNSIKSTPIQLDHESWGLDHGTWSVLRHIYPKAQIPVLQLSLDINQTNDYHIEIGKELNKLRNEGILIIGSGNLVHNLRRVRWEPNAKAYDWATEFDNWTKLSLVNKDYETLFYNFNQSESGKLSVPTLEHYLPLHYILSASDDNDKLDFIYEEIQNGSISMRSFILQQG